MDKRNDVNNLDDTLDWEYMSDFYANEGNEVGSLEDYMSESDLAEPTDEFVGGDGNDTLHQIINDVKKVRELNDQGKNVEQIAEILAMDEDYVTLILMSMNGSPEDSSDIAIAHLVELG